MQIIFEADLNKMTEELQKLSPDRFLRILAVAVKNMAKRNAHEAGKGGKSFWQREILPSIREEVSPDHFSVYSDSYIAAHIHHGGEIKPKKSQFLAQIVWIPPKSMPPTSKLHRVTTRIFTKKTQISPIIVYYFHFLSTTLIRIFIIALKSLSL